MKCLCLATALLASVVFFSCKRHHATPTPAPMLTVNRTTMTLGIFLENADSFTVQSNIDWKLTITPASATTWMQVSKTQGEAGTTTVKVNILSAGAATQSAIITLTPAASNAPLASVTASQKVYAIDPAFKKMFGGNMDEVIYSMARTADGGIVALAQLTAKKTVM